MAESLPTSQKAAIYDKPLDPIRIEQVKLPVPDFDDILVKILYSGVCHSDLHGWKGEFPALLRLKYPIIGGHEGAGYIVKLGSHVKNYKLGERIGVKWMNGICTSCEFCLKGFESSCLNPLYTGFFCDGTFQQYALVKARDAIRIPEEVDLAQAAPIFCAGMTVYRGLKEAGLKAGETIAIVGCGGGLGLLGVQFAKAMGYRVFGIDAVEKRETCIESGVDLFIDTCNPAEIPKKILELTPGGLGVNAVLNVATSIKAIETSLQYLRPRGTAVLIAIPPEEMKVDLFYNIMKSITIKCSLVGNRQDAIEALEFVARGQVKVPLEMYTLEDLPKIFEKLENGQITGRAVIDLWK